jgi:hypothetical protein
MVMDRHSHNDDIVVSGDSHDGLTERTNNARGSARLGRSGRTSARAVAVADTNSHRRQGSHGIAQGSGMIIPPLGDGHSSDDDEGTQVSFGVTPTQSLSHSVMSALTSASHTPAIPPASSSAIDSSSSTPPRINRAHSAPKTRTSIRGSPSPIVDNDTKSTTTNANTSSGSNGAISDVRPTTTGTVSGGRRTASTSWLQLSSKVTPLTVAPVIDASINDIIMNSHRIL